jgi:prepilin-type N-terminal cleavage/methylation domain-containing protein
MLIKMKSVSAQHRSTFCRPSGPRAESRQRGFTLVELVIVMVIAAMILALGIPNLVRAKIRSEMLRQVKMFRQAVAVSRISAIREGNRVIVSFENLGNTGGRLVAWVDNDLTETISMGDTVLYDKRVPRKFSVNQDGTLRLYRLGGAATRRGVVFLPNGTGIVNEAGVAGIGQGAAVITDTRGNQLRLRILAGSGTVIEEMRDPSTGDWDAKSTKYWRY